MRWPDAGLRARAAELRAEWRAEEEEWTRAAFERFEHGRTLTDVLRAAMHRGDEVLLGLGADALRGVLTHVGDDWCALDTPAGACDVPVAHGAPVVCVVERARRGGVAGDPDAPASWRARLLAHEVAGHDCAVGLAGAHVVTGALRAGADHVVVGHGAYPGAETYVPCTAVLWVRVAGRRPAGASGVSGTI